MFNSNGNQSSFFTPSFLLILPTRTKKKEEEEEGAHVIDNPSNIATPIGSHVGFQSEPKRVNSPTLPYYFLSLSSIYLSFLSFFLSFFFTTIVRVRVSPVTDKDAYPKRKLFPRDRLLVCAVCKLYL